MFKRVKQVLQMERMILRTLAFGVSSPTVNWFCLYLLREMEAADRASFLTLVGILHCCIIPHFLDWFISSIDLSSVKFACLLCYFTFQALSVCKYHC